MSRIVTVGVTFADEIYTLPRALVPGEKHRASHVSHVLGGNPVNSALAIARLGGAVHLVSRLGDDAAGRAARVALAGQGIDVSLCGDNPGCASSRSIIVIEPNGERTIVNYLDPALPDRPVWLPQALPAGTDAVLGDIRWEAGTRHIFERARAMGALAVFDGDRKPEDLGLLDLATHSVFSAQGLRELTGVSDLAEALKALGRGGHLGVTDGAAGVYALEGGAVTHYPSFPITPVDTLGAGDVWHGAYALGLAERMPIPAAIRFASATAALKCTRPGGGGGAPTRGEVEALLRG